MSAEDILIRSSNIETLMLAQKIGENDYKELLKNKSVKCIEFTIEKRKPLNFIWNKCKLETISFGHGIASHLQADQLYRISNGGYLTNQL